MAHSLFESSIEADYFPLFEELHIVLIGCHGAGKNTVGNALLRKNVFSYRTTYERHNAKRERAVFGRRITVVRVPGWSADLNPEEAHPEIKQEIRDGIKEFKNGPHAIILCATDSSTATNKIMETLQNLFSDKVWDHTIIVFTHGKKKNKTTEEHIKTKELHPNLLKWPTFEQSRKLIEEVEEMIARKNASFNFCLPEQKRPEQCLEEKTKLLTIIKDKLNMLEKEGPKDIKKIARIKAEKARLNDLLKHVEEQIALLQTNGENQPDIMMFTVTTPREHMLKDPFAMITNVVEYDADEQLALKTPPPYTSTEEAMTHKRQSALKPDLHGWGSTLVNVLDELKEQQFESMKVIIGFRDKWKIPRSKLDRSRAEVAELMIQTWGEHVSIINIRDIMKQIPRNDQAITSLIIPFLEAIGEEW